jgi:hypothetical protein
LRTPSRIAASQLSIFGSIPPEIVPSALRTSVWARLKVEKSVEGSSGSFMSPGTSDTSTNFRTFSDRASAAAAMSALTL